MEPPLTCRHATVLSVNVTGDHQLNQTASGWGRQAGSLASTLLVALAVYDLGVTASMLAFTEKKLLWKKKDGQNSVAVAVFIQMRIIWIIHSVVIIL